MRKPISFAHVPRWIDCKRVTFKYGLGQEFIDVLRTLRADPRTKSVAIVIFSGFLFVIAVFLGIGIALTAYSTDNEDLLVAADWLGFRALNVVDIAAMADVAHGHGAALIVDATFVSPMGLRALDHGADLEVGRGIRLSRL